MTCPHEFIDLENPSSNRRCKLCTYEYDGFVVGITRAEPKLFVLDDPITVTSTAKIQKWFGDYERGQAALELVEEAGIHWGEWVKDLPEGFEMPGFLEDFRVKAKALLEGEK